MKIKDLLPVGSIVLLEGGEKRLAIIGVKQTNEGGTGLLYDYLGVVYPEGYIGSDFEYLFNHEDIKEIIYRGFEDEERVAFIERLSTFYANNDENQE